MSGHELNDVDFISSTHEAELIITWFQKHGINDFIWSKEKKECKSNTEILQKQIEKCTIVEIPKYRHGELAIGNHRFVGMTGEAVSVRNGKSHIHYVYETEIVWT